MQVLLGHSAAVAVLDIITQAKPFVWQAAGALDAGLHLTELGRWGLPRALAWAWGGDFDQPPRS